VNVEVGYALVSERILDVPAGTEEILAVADLHHDAAIRLAARIVEGIRGRALYLRDFLDGQHQAHDKPFA
jgi:hypothetical protein